MEQQKKKPYKRAVILITVWIVTVFMTGHCAWELRSNQYRSYAEQSLKDAVVSGINHIHGLIEDCETTGRDIPIEQIVYQCYRIDSQKQVLRNIYVKKNPGELSTSPSVWSLLGDAGCVIQEGTNNDLEKAFFENLNALCKEWLVAWQNEENKDFEYELIRLEESLQALVETVISS